jgi:hypothetical protein
VSCRRGSTTWYGHSSSSFCSQALRLSGSIITSVCQRLRDQIVLCVFHFRQALANQSRQHGEHCVTGGSAGCLGMKRGISAVPARGRVRSLISVAPTNARMIVCRCQCGAAARSLRTGPWRMQIGGPAPCLRQQHRCQDCRHQNSSLICPPVRLPYRSSA